MNMDTSTILNELWKLPPEVRVAHAGRLLDSIGQPDAPELEAELENDIAPRLKELDNSNVKTIPWSEARRIIAREWRN